MSEALIRGLRRAKIGPLLTYCLICFRRAYLNNFLAKRGDTKLISTSASPILGTPDSMTSDNPKIRSYIERTYERGVEESNKHTH